MLNAGVLTFREFAMHEPLPLATVQQAILRRNNPRRETLPVRRMIDDRKSSPLPCGREIGPRPLVPGKEAAK